MLRDDEAEGAARVIDEAFIRTAVNEADLNALRVALFQATGDPRVAAIGLERTTVRGGAGTLAVIPAEDQQTLKELAIQYLLDEAPRHRSRVPTNDELDRLIVMAEGSTVSHTQLDMRRGLLCFDPFPRLASWSGRRPVLSPDFCVMVIGAGFSGVAMGVQLGQLGIPYLILEKREEVGGVWSTNTYPDARVDTLTATYQFGFEKNYPWTEYFARQDEVRNYLEHVAHKHGVHEHIRFGCDVKAAEFDEKTSTWTVHVRTSASPESAEETLRADVLVSACGLFAVPKELDIDGADSFAGELVHTTQWDRTRTADGKRVAVIGNGSTGVQLLGRIAQVASHVEVFQRTPQWIAPRERYGEIMTEQARWLLEAMPYYWNWSRYTAVMPLFDARELLVPDEEWIAGGGYINQRSDTVRAGLMAYIKSQVGDRIDLVDKLVPSYAPIARRPVVDNGWYRALTRDNVRLVTEPITRMTARGIVTEDGVEHPFDMVIAAIGFQTSRYLWPTEYRGVGGTSLHEKWKKCGPQAYVGMTVPQFPNLFILYGPNSQPVSGGATLPVWFEIWSEYIAEAIVAMLERGAVRVEVREDVFEEYNTRLDAEAAKLIYLTDAGSRERNYYVNDYGRLQINVPWEADEFYRYSLFDPDDFIFSP